MVFSEERQPGCYYEPSIVCYAVRMIEIRRYEPRQDRQAVKNLMVELLDLEKEVEPEWEPTQEIIEPYFRYMLQRGRKFEGEIFVAEDNGKVIGFISVWGKMKPNNPGDSQEIRAFISDFIVQESYRNAGLGRRLIAVAEDYARQKGVSTIRLQATGNNIRGRRFYQRAGYRELVVEHVKRLK